MDFGCSSFTWRTEDGRHLLGRTYDQFGDLTANRVISVPQGMPCGAFAALCGTTKETLRHYKDVGLLLPAHQGDNGYFYYDVEQFYTGRGRPPANTVTPVWRCLASGSLFWWTGSTPLA